MSLDDQKLKQLEEKYGFNAPEKTEVIIGFEKILDVIRYGFTLVREVLDNFWDAKFVSIFPLYFADGFKEASSLVKDKGIKIRIITEVKEDNLESVKKISSLFEVRHLQGITGNFGILDRRQYVAVLFSAYDKPPEQTFFSNSKIFVEQQQYIFDTLWENALPSRVKIREIELANQPDFINSVIDKQELSNILRDLIEGSAKEILILLPRPESFYSVVELDINEALRDAKIRNIDIRILIAGVAKDEFIHGEDLRRLNITVRYLPTKLSNTRIDIVIDYKFTISIEERYGKSTPDENDLGLAIYSNVESKAMVSSSIFENYWMKAS